MECRLRCSAIFSPSALTTGVQRASRLRGTAGIFRGLSQDRTPYPRRSTSAGRPVRQARRASPATYPARRLYCFNFSTQRHRVAGPRPRAASPIRSNLSFRHTQGSGCLSSFCGALVSTLDGRSVGFSTRRENPSNRESSSIDND
jgi:hypothetical protein